MTPPRRAAPTPSIEITATTTDEQRRLQQVYALYARPLADDLQAAGFPVQRLRDLRRRTVGGPAALPILLHWLPLVTFAPLKVDVIYALGSPWARPTACAPLLAEHSSIRHEPGEAARRVRAAICGSLERIADETVLDEIIALAIDPELGTERALAIVALGNMRTCRDTVAPILIELLADDQIELYALLGLSKLDARDSIREFAYRIRHRNEMIRRLAIRTVAAWTSDRPAPDTGNGKTAPLA